VNFGHRPWWYGGQFCQTAVKIWKKNISKRNNLNERKKIWGWSKIRNKLCIKN
jgi:hypothetical protein